MKKKQKTMIHKNFLKKWESDKKKLIENNIYNQEDEHSS